MIDHLDHLVLTTTQLEACKDFYVRVLGSVAVSSRPRRRPFCREARQAPRSLVIPNE
ncbi:hypothetical protein [Pseudomonas sp. Leaf127]|uniref:hypothetical protein n=1 Tax=Pseudomonas sp. Leaf127 TaxID=1736267 RepID=UPI000AEDB25B|nr:hypothetical protein [Pseudomonas sp. Leaf127]